MFLSFNSHEQDQELLFNSALNFSYLYRRFIEGGKGLNCDGLFQLYSSGIDSLDDDFEILNLTLKPLDKNELAPRIEDGGLNKEELTELFFGQTSEVKIDEEANRSFLVDYIFSLFREFTNGEKGLTCDGLLHLYGLRVDLKHLGHVWLEEMNQKKWK
ncbi:hypothetical protein Tco_0157514 [Tanacetum coccineum]